MSDDYTPRPRLGLLADELAVLNEKLIAQGLPDNIRMARLRHFAEASKAATGISIAPVIEAVEADTSGYAWRAELAGKWLGTFSTPMKAFNAYKAAHIARHGIGSEFHPDHAISRAHMCDDLPKGISLTPAGTYRVEIGVNGKMKRVGTYGTIDEAEAAYNAAKEEEHQSRDEAVKKVMDDRGLVKVDKRSLATAERILKSVAAINAAGGLPRGVQMTSVGRFIARARINGRDKKLGVFDTVSEAKAAYEAVRRQHGDRRRVRGQCPTQPTVKEGYRQIGDTFETIILNQRSGIACLTPYTTLQRARAAFLTTMMQRGGQWRFINVKRTGDNEFKAHVRAPHGRIYKVGPFASHDEAVKTITATMSGHGRNQQTLDGGLPNFGIGESETTASPVAIFH